MKAMQKTTLREIRGTFGRFFAILAIVALGTGFFSGVRITTPAMVHTVNQFLQTNQFYDYRLLSTLGWEETEVAAFRQQPDVRYAEGAYTLDVLYLVPGAEETGIERTGKAAEPEPAEEAGETEAVYKTHSLPEAINQVQLASGRFPEQPGECLADAGTSKLQVGDCIRVAPGNTEDTLAALHFDTLTVVGTAYSSYYVNFERGTTAIGNGSVAGYVYILPEDFQLDYYSEIFIRFDRDDVLYSTAYQDFMAEKNATWEAVLQEQADARYERIRTDAETELAEAEQELEDQRSEAEAELEDAKTELEKAAEELDDGKAELEKAAKELDDGKAELDQAAQELDDGKAELDTARQQLADGRQELDAIQETLEQSGMELEEAWQKLEAAEAELLSGEETFENSRKQLEDGQTALQQGQAQADMAAETLRQSQAELEAQEAELANRQEAFRMQMAEAESVWDALPEEQQQTLLATQAQLTQAQETLAAARMQLEAGQQELRSQQEILSQKQQEIHAGMLALEEAKQTLADGRADYEQGLAEYEDGRLAYEDGLAQYEAAEETWQESRQQLAEAEQAYETGLQDYEEGKKTYASGLQEYEDGEKDYASGLQEYQDGQKAYQDGKAELEAEITNAQQKLLDARQELDDLEAPVTYLLDRNTNIGYACFESDSQIVEQIARVFPVFFILVAALVCMTTMSRMVEEQRTQIGTLKALGYAESAIMGKFLVYSGSAALLGCIIGYFLGTAVFPQVIWMSYELMYTPLPMQYLFDGKLALLSLAASLLCSMGTTWISCHHELAETTAGLMRPKAPKAAKRVFLEYIPFIWNRLKFLHKVSVRNIFRYKRRFFMMIAGISGCTALLLTGFGINDSIAGFADVQYTEILVADAAATLRTDTSVSGELEQILEEQTASWLLLHQASWDLLADGKTKGITLLAPDGDMKPYFLFHTCEQESMAFPGVNEAIISNSISERYHIMPGDSITLRNEDMQQLQLTVTGVFENHVYNYIFIAPETITAQLAETPEYNMVYMNFPEDADPYQTAAVIAGNDAVTIVTLFQDLKIRMANMMDSLKYIVLLVIVCAAGLAFIVLYNLTNINITERIREIATIKVLGFFRHETSAYVLRENLALTAMGIAAGLVLGVLLHRFIMLQIVVDMVSFKIRILPMSFLYSILLTFLFNFLVNLFMEFKLERINMAESLKSVD